MNYLVFLCYGTNQRVFHECVYALLSLTRVCGADGLKDTEIWIYTDNAPWFKTFKDCTLPLHFRELDSSLIKQWRGDIDFVHRVKIETLLDFTSTRSGNVLYVDSDIVFTGGLQTIFKNIAAGSLYMHIAESRISQMANPLFTKMNRFLQSNKLQLNGKPLNEMMMWNAGVLGFNTKYNYLLKNVLEFTDREYPKFPKHIIEQFAFSVYFQDTANIKAAAYSIFHYWNLKEAGQLLASFFSYFKNSNWAELTEYSTLITLDNLMQQKVAFLGNRKLTDMLTKTNWDLTLPDWAEMQKQI